MQIAAIIPCYNEAAAIARVISDFQTHLPEAKIYVFDNNSTDNTAEIARKAGAMLRTVYRKGKGNVIRRMFADVEADIYVMVDGDSTYDISAAPKLIERLAADHLDMVVGTRVDSAEDKTAYRPGHRFGNTLFNAIVSFCFGSTFTDVFSGYRVFSRRFAKSFPAMSKGFDTETEITIHALELNLPCAEIPTQYGSRPENSESKLNSIQDGFKILLRIVLLLKETRPLLFFGVIFLALAVISSGIFIPVFIDYIKTGLVPRFPTAILSSALMLLGFLSLVCGLILDNVSRSKRSMNYLFYLMAGRKF